MKAKLARLPALERKPEDPHIWIATPAYGGQFSGHYVQGLLNLCRSLDRSKVRFTWDPMLNESLVSRARNRLAAEFLKTKGATHLMFIDADIGFSPQDVQRLTISNYDVVCGMYPMKNYGWEMIRQAALRGVPAKELPLYGALFAMNATSVSTKTGDVDVQIVNGNRYVEVLDGATGFMCISRKALEKYVDHYRAEIEYTADYSNHLGETHWDIFGVGIDRSAKEEGQPARYLSEDYWFCRKWQQMGGKVHVCLDCKLSHAGFHIWQGNPDVLLEPAAEEKHDTDAPPAPTGEVDTSDVVFVEPTGSDGE